MNFTPKYENFIDIQFDCKNVSDLKRLKYIGSGTKYLIISLMIWLHNGAGGLKNSKKDL
jgi:hypothetical protein